MWAVEGMYEATAIGGDRPAHRLHGTAHPERVLVEGQFPIVVVDAALEHQPAQIAVGGDVVESVVVDTFMREVGGHSLSG